MHWFIKVVLYTVVLGTIGGLALMLVLNAALSTEETPYDVGFWPVPVVWIGAFITGYIRFGTNDAPAEGNSSADAKKS